MVIRCQSWLLSKTLSQIFTDESQENEKESLEKRASWAAILFYSLLKSKLVTVMVQTCHIETDLLLLDIHSETTASENASVNCQL